MNNICMYHSERSLGRSSTSVQNVKYSISELTFRISVVVCKFEVVFNFLLILRYRFHWSTLCTASPCWYYKFDLSKGVEIIFVSVRETIVN